MIGMGTAVMGFCSQGERSDSPPSIARASEGL